MVIDKSFKKWESIKDLAISVDWGFKRCLYIY